MWDYVCHYVGVSMKTTIMNITHNEKSKLHVGYDETIIMNCYH